MDTKELFTNCRLGNLERVKYLVEQREVDLNVRDRWDSTPLYYASLCGHEELVDYLIDSGAKCEAQTFDGERIFYGALTNEIRNKLRNYKVVTSSTLARDNYEEFLRKLLDMGEYSDFTFYVQGQGILVHRFILSARSHYFYEAFKNRWANRTSKKMQGCLVDYESFQSFLQYLYTGRLRTAIDNVSDCLRLAVQCCLPDLKERLKDSYKRAMSFAETKPGTRIKVLSMESEDQRVELQRDLRRLAEHAIPSNIIRDPESTNPPKFIDFSFLVDVCFIVEDHKFPCQKAAFAGRSDYFRALFQDHFGETSHENKGNENADDEHSVDVLILRDVTAEVFAQVVLYVYSNYAKPSAETVYDLLNAGELYLMPGLKKICANFLINNIDNENVIDMIRISRTYQLPRLEDYCYEHIALHLNEVAPMEDFHSLIVEDAAEVKGRQETDTIGTVDDVRYHITQIHQDSLEAYAKHKLIDDLLEKLNLTA